jgi:hypothetical protein
MSAGIESEVAPLHFTRPSILEPRAFVDSWVSACCSEHLVVYLNNQPISLFPGSTLDQSSLNDLLFALHHRYPRQAN